MRAVGVADEGSQSALKPKMSERTVHPESSRALGVYLLVVVVAGALVLGHSVFAAAHTPKPLWWLALGGTVILAGWFRMNFASVSATIGIEDTFLIRDGR